MPMRRIHTSLPTVGFAQDPSPLTEGMLHAASTLGELWPRLKQIEAEKQRRTDDNNEHRRARDEDIAIRKQDRLDALHEREGERKHAQSLWNATHAVSGDNAVEDYAKRAAEDDALRRDEHLADTGNYNGDNVNLYERQARGQKDRALHTQGLQKQIDRPYFATPRPPAAHQSGVHETPDKKQFFIKDGEVNFINRETGAVTPSSVLVANEAAAADEEKKAAERAAIISSGHTAGNLWGYLYGADSDETILAKDAAEKAKASRLWDEQHPVPNNLPPGVTSDDPHGVSVDDQGGEVDPLGNPVLPKGGLIDSYNENAQLNKLNKTTRASYDAIMAEGDPKRVAAAKQMLKGL